MYRFQRISFLFIVFLLYNTEVLFAQTAFVKKENIVKELWGYNFVGHATATERGHQKDNSGKKIVGGAYCKLSSIGLYTPPLSYTVKKAVQGLNYSDGGEGVNPLNGGLMIQKSDISGINRFYSSKRVWVYDIFNLQFPVVSATGTPIRKGKV